MQFIHCETYQGAMAAVHLEFPTRELYGPSEPSLGAQVISPVVIDQLGEAHFLLPVRTVEEAIALAKTQIEQNNYAYMVHVRENRVPAENAVRHFEDCGISAELFWR